MSKAIILSLLFIFVALLAGASSPGQITDIAIGSSIVQPSVKRLGINLSEPTYYDAGQMTKNLVFRNPGFEGGIYNSIVRCESGSSTSCTDENTISSWPAGFWKGATFEIFYGAGSGRRGTVSAYTAANGKTIGGKFTFSAPGPGPNKGDYMIVRLLAPGNATAGWWVKTSGAATIGANAADLPTGTAGLQTAAICAPTAKDAASLKAYFDSDAGRSFVLLDGTFHLSFKAKGTGGANAIALSLQRIGLASYLSQTVSLTNAWATYSFSFTATEAGSALHAVELQFATVGEDSFLLDDVSLTQIDSDPLNTTAFRDPVVNTLHTLHPGVLRSWAGQLGDTLDNLIADPYGRQRAGYSAWHTTQEDISYGLPEFLQLCESIGAEPWFVIPSTFDTTDASNLIEYLAGSAATHYGSKRAASGHPNPWASSFSKIHLEFGNEAWNSAFKGGAIEYPEPYGRRAQAIFAAMKSNSSYNATAFDLVLGGQAVSPGRNREIQDNCNNNDSFALAPYMMGTIDSFADNEHLFGSTFAEAEALISPAGTAEGVTGGLMTLNQQAIKASAHPVPLVMYEMNLSTLAGSISQTALNSYVSSLGAGLAVIDAMLLEMREGVRVQNLWNLTQYNFTRPDGSKVFLWGAVVDMGVTNRRRPQFLAMQLINHAIGTNANMLRTVQSGDNPTWNQPLVNKVQLAAAHYIQSFAFASGSTMSVVLFNLSRSSTLHVAFSGVNAPSGNVEMQELTSASPADTNENSETISIIGHSIANFDSSGPISLPPCSVISISWEKPHTHDSLAESR